MFKKLMQLPKIVISISMLFSSFGFNFIKVNASEIYFLKSSINEQYLARGSAKGYTVTYTVTSTGYTYFDNPF